MPIPVTITAKKNGPYRVEATDGAEIKVVDPSTLLPDKERRDANYAQVLRFAPTGRASKFSLISKRNDGVL